MASWYWNRSKGGRKYVRVYARDKDGKVRALPSEVVAHLHHLDDHNIDFWVADYERNFESPKRRVQDLPSPQLSKWVHEYLAYLAIDERRDPKTIAAHDKAIHDSVLPFFTGQDPIYPDPKDWPCKAVGFKHFLLADSTTANDQVHRALRAYAALRGFWRFLVEQRYVQGSADLILRHIRRPPGTTPLKRIVSPEELIQFVDAQTPDRGCLAFLAIAGFALSLRPQESFALRAADFICGQGAESLEVCRVNAQYGLFDKLAVRVHRQRHQQADYDCGCFYPDNNPYPVGFKPPKGGAIARVACFSREAAERLRPFLAKAKAEGETENLLLPEPNDYYFDLWDAEGMKDTSLKDLRRSSIHWLGHNTNLPPVALKTHARHRRLETTMLYCRTPEETPSDIDTLDLINW